MKILLLLLFLTTSVMGIEYPEQDMRAYKHYKQTGQQLVAQKKALAIQIEKLEDEGLKIENQITDLRNKIRALSDSDQRGRKYKILYKSLDKLRNKGRVISDEISKLNSEERKLDDKLETTKKKFDYYKAKVQAYYSALKTEKIKQAEAKKPQQEETTEK